MMPDVSHNVRRWRVKGKRDRRCWLRRGSAEFVALAFLTPVFVFCILALVTTMQYARAASDLDEAASLAARVASQSGSLTIAQDRAEVAASACATHPSLENLDVSIRTEDGEWATGKSAVLVLTADVRVMMPVVGVRRVARRIVFTVERAST